MTPATVTPEDIKTYKVEASPADRRNLQAAGKTIKAAYHDAIRMQAAARALLNSIKPADPADDCDDSTFEAWYSLHEAACEKAGTEEANRRLHEAEAAVLLWGREVIQKYFPKHWEQVEIVFTQGIKRPDIRQKTLDSSLKLEL